LNVYKELGSRLKHSFQGNEAWVISSSYDCFDSIGLKASARIPLYNGDLDCEFRKYELFQGKYKGFRDEGNALKKDFAPLKRKSRLTGADGEQRPPRNKEREADSFSSEIDSDSMRRRRELESYFNTYKSRKEVQRKNNNDERREQRNDERPRRNDERPRRNEGAPRGEYRSGARDNRRKDDARPYSRGGKPEARGNKPAKKDYGRKTGDFKPLRGGKRVKNQ
jgi:putative N6-adenine-specific DNA methylase